MHRLLLVQFGVIDCDVVEELCTYTPATTVPTLDVPLGAPAGENLGTIVYTISGPSPSGPSPSGPSP